MQGMKQKQTVMVVQCLSMSPAIDEDGFLTGESAASSSSSSSCSLTDEETMASLSSASSSPSTWGNLEQRSSSGPLYELSSLMDQLPIKKGLSKFFQGKSESFTSLSKVINLDDLAKKTTPHKTKRKPRRIWKEGTDGNNMSHYTPGPSCKTISKKAPRGVLHFKSSNSCGIFVYK